MKANSMKVGRNTTRSALTLMGALACSGANQNSNKEKEAISSILQTQTNSVLNLGENTQNTQTSAFAGFASEPGVKVVQGDFDGDGRSDIALVGGKGWGSIPVAYSTGQGNFDVRYYSHIGFPKWASEEGVSVLSGDFNGDGKTDIALTSVLGWATLPVAFSNGKGSFTVTNESIGPFATFSSTRGARALTGDFNGDGLTDVALDGLGILHWDILPVAYSRGDGQFDVTINHMYQFIGLGTGRNETALVGNFNQDRSMDIAYTGNSVYNLPGYSDLWVAVSTEQIGLLSNFYEAGDFGRMSNTPNVAPFTGDFNGDGQTDIALVGQGFPNSIPVAFSGSDSNFTITNSPVEHPGDWPVTMANSQAVLSGDFDGDGRTDIALTGSNAFPMTSVLLSHGDGSFHFIEEYNRNFSSWVSQPGVKALAGDFNGDGKTDMALLGRTGWKTIPVATSNGDGTFTVTNNLVP